MHKINNCAQSVIQKQNWRQDGDIQKLVRQEHGTVVEPFECLLLCHSIIPHQSLLSLRSSPITINGESLHLLNGVHARMKIWCIHVSTRENLSLLVQP